MAAKDHAEIKGSEREPLAGARAIGPADPDEHVEVTMVLRRPGAGPAMGRAVLSRAEFAEAHSASTEDVREVQAFAARHGLQVVRSDAVSRTVVVAGAVAEVEAAFDVQLSQFEHQGYQYRGRTGPVHVPAALADRVVAVLGLDNRPQARAHYRVARPVEEEQVFAPRAAAQAFRPPDLAAAYDFPQGQGEGQCIGILELGGGLRRSDLRAYFNQLGLPTPQLHTVSVGAHNRPSGPNSADGEVMLDVEVAGAIAPAATLVVYFAPNTDAGFLNALNAAVHDTTYAPSVISISWGGPEVAWTSQSLDAFDAACQDACALGVTVFCAAGDSGSGDGVTDHKAHVDFPASSPHVVGCGGTHLSVSNQGTQEVVWSTNGATGGGISDYFDVPDYQEGAGVPPSANPPGDRAGRGVPDVAGDADPATGYVVRVDGSTFVIGGTSAVAPLWAGLTALLNEQLGSPVGFLNPALYEVGAQDGSFRDVTTGSNGDYHAGPGWDPCTGWGSPNGTALAAALGT